MNKFLTASILIIVSFLSPIATADSIQSRPGVQAGFDAIGPSIDELYVRYVTSARIVDTCIAQGLAPKESRPAFNYYAHDDSIDLFADKNLADYEEAESYAKQFIADTDKDTISEICGQVASLTRYDF
ncbi:hypothetical protein [Paraferrimonas haliotis]|uniref:Uncharacterized protein n=1 Tax=Paraferrimonas haliotis TaxID=2013866 RepID=A0AA37TKZ9_9GAMM|nr:hypothetical protein [Paraferrimonas haliotis]GLS82438.1 hypothetical protein GCM10007894_04150 [Paraferrimonas haliotis]